MDLGDVVWIDFPAGAGRAQAGRRPAIVLQTSSASSHLPTVLVVPLTTQIAALRYPGTVLINPDADNGLTKPSVALVFQLCAIDVNNVGARIGAIKNDVIQSLRDALLDLVQ